MEMYKNLNKYKIIFLLVIFVFLLIWLLCYILYGKSITPWALYPPFADVITITGSVDCMSHGFDPYTVTVFDPWGRTFCYPPIWINIFSFFCLDKSATNYIGIIYIILFYIFTLFSLKIEDIKNMLIYLFLFLSPPILLLMERGNSDIILYFIVIISLFYLRSNSESENNFKIYISYGLILFASLLKLYPIILISLIIYEKIAIKHKIIISSTVIITFLLYVFSSDFIVHVLTNVAKSSFSSYGSNIILIFFFNLKNSFIISFVLSIIVFFIAIIINLKFKEKIFNIINVDGLKDRRYYNLFLAGMIIFCGTFVIGSNWNYRFVFLLITIPYFLEMIKQKNDNNLKYLIVLIFCILYGTLCVSVIRHIAPYKEIFYAALVFQHLLTWILYFIFSMILINQLSIIRNVNLFFDRN